MNTAIYTNDFKFGNYTTSFGLPTVRVTTCGIGNSPANPVCDYCRHRNDGPTDEDPDTLKDDIKALDERVAKIEALLIELNNRLERNNVTRVNRD